MSKGKRFEILFIKFFKSSVDMSYFDVLNKDALFEVLLRLHYPDLLNFISTYPDITIITNSEYFKTKWKEYNISEVKVTGTTNRLEVYACDRLGLKHGVSTSYLCGIKESTTEYIQDIINGNDITYYSAYVNGGCPQVEEKRTYVGGVLNGPITGWSKDGEVSFTSFYKNGYLDGIFMEYRSDGRNTLTEYKQGLKHGKMFHWDEHGQRIHEFTLADDKFTGIERSWYPDGQIKYKTLYRDDRKFNSQWWDANGKPFGN